MTIPVFPVLIGIDWPIKRTPIWSTQRQKSISGQETAQPLWSYPKWRYELSFSLLRSAAAFMEWQSLLGLFNQVAGGAGVFAYADSQDNSATLQSFGVGDGVTTQFQLVRALGGFVEPVLLPVASTIYASTTGGTTALASSGVYTIGSTGLVTFAAAPAAGTSLLWTGTFNWLCRFDADELSFQQDMPSLWTLQSCIFTTVKL